MSTPEKYNATLKARQWLTDDVLLVTLELQKPMDFIAGQFVMLDVPTDKRPRAFSMVNRPSDGEGRKIVLCIKKYDTSVTAPYLESLDIGDSLTLKGPFGSFVVSAGNRPLYFVATGVGIAPIIGQLQQLSLDGDKRNRTVIFGVRHYEDQIFSDSLLTKSDDCTVCISQPDQAWDGPSGRVTDILKEKADLHQSDFYLCGSPEMIRDTKALLKERGVPDDQVHFEIF